MNAQRVLVAFASRSGSTAGIAEAIAVELRRAGLAVDSLPAGDVTDLTPYAAVILGSGMFLPRRRSDGGGFLVRHAAALRTRAMWLYSAGPIGHAHDTDGAGPAGSGDCSVAEVGRSVGARGSASFAAPAPAPSDDPFTRLAPVDLPSVRAWAREIGADLAATKGEAVTAKPAIPASHGCRRARRSRAVAAG